MKPYWLVTCLCIFLVVPVVAEELWYQAYENALKAIKRGDYKTAEAKLKIALKQEPGDQKKNRKYYGVNATGDYFPDYYLGVVYFNQQKYKEAEEQFQKADQMNLRQEDSVRFAEMQSYRQKIEIAQKPTKPPEPEINKAQLAKQEAEGHITKSQKLAESNEIGKAEVELDLARQKDPANNSIRQVVAFINRKKAGNLDRDARQKIQAGDLKEAGTLVQQIKDIDSSYPALAELSELLAKKDLENQSNLRKDEFEKLIAQSRLDLANKKYSQARASAQNASALGIDPNQINLLLKSIDIAESLELTQQAVERKAFLEAERQYRRLALLDATNPRLTTLKKAIEEGLKGIQVQDLEKQGLLAFYKGDYNQSLDLLQRVAQQKKDSAKVFFYIGCSRSALLLMTAQNDREKFRRQIKSDFTKVRQLDPSFKHDTRYISPAILSIYNES